MNDDRVRPDRNADERTVLVGWLDLQRDLVAWKCSGLDDADAHRSVLVSSPLMTVAGLVSHLRWTEHLWFEVMFLDHPVDPNPQFDESVGDADMRVDETPLEALLADYAQQWRTSNEIIAAHALDAAGRNTRFGDGTASLRWMIAHMLEETARHLGHLDTIRELLDGSTGYW